MTSVEDNNSPPLLKAASVLFYHTLIAYRVNMLRSLNEHTQNIS